MIIDKAELTRKIDKLKNVVPKSSHNPTLTGILAQNDYLIASNGEMTVKAKLEGMEGEAFIIPSKAFDLIKNLPEGEVSIIADDRNMITIKTGNIINSYQSLPIGDFMYSSDRIAESQGNAKIHSSVLKESMAHVLYAIPSKHNNIIMTALCLEASGGKLNFVGLDGHVLAWDQQEFDGKFQLLIPKSAVEKLLSLDMTGNVAIEYDKSNAIFRSEEYEVHTRLIEGKYFAYAKMLNNLPMITSVKKIDMLDAVVRAKLCTDELTPTKFEIEDNVLKLSIKDSTADYSETVLLQESMEKLKIAFNSRLVLETLKAFSCENISISFGGSKLPMIIKAADSDMQALVLPVQISETA